MKTIEITDEMYNRLIEIATNLTEQDPRATAMPHLFQIRTINQSPAAEGCGTKAWHYDGSVIHKEDDIREAIIEHTSYELGTAQAEKAYEKYSEEDKEHLLEKIGYREIWFEETYEYKNAFFTEKACKEHIEKNHYHYNQPVGYLNHAWRNPEIETIQEFLCALVGKEMHK